MVPVSGREIRRSGARISRTAHGSFTQRSSRIRTTYSHPCFVTTPNLVSYRDCKATGESSPRIGCTHGRHPTGMNRDLFVPRFSIPPDDSGSHQRAVQSTISIGKENDTEGDHVGIVLANARQHGSLRRSSALPMDERG